MSESDSPGPLGRVASLHLHPRQGGDVLQTVAAIDVVEQKGIVGNPRKFGKLDRSGKPSKRQVSLIEREQISEHATTLGLETISPGTIRSNIETSGVNLVSLIGKEVEIGSAILFFYEARTGCAQMDAICTGLRELTKGNRLGVLAQVVRSGRIEVGDEISLVKEPVAS
jgi:MOSC domain-containing protein YiiM